MSGDTKKLPIYRHAAEQTVALYSYGSVITHEWLLDQLEIVPPKIGTPEQFQAYSLRRLEDVTDYREELLREHNMATTTIRGVGYVIVLPGEQATLAMRELEADVTRAIRKTRDKLVHTKIDALTADEARQRTDAMGKLAAFAAMRQLKLADTRAEPPPTAIEAEITTDEPGDAP